MSEASDYYSVNLNQLIDNTSCSSTARILALTLKQSNGYLTIGELLKKIPDEFLKLVSDIESADEERRNKIYMELMEVMLVLNHAEGGTIKESDIAQLINSTLVLVVMESLSRRGFVDMQYQNASLTDRLDAPLAAVTQTGVDFVKRYNGEQGNDS